MGLRHPVQNVRSVWKGKHAESESDIHFFPNQMSRVGRHERDMTHSFWWSKVSHLAKHGEGQGKTGVTVAVTGLSLFV